MADTQYEEYHQKLISFREIANAKKKELAQKYNLPDNSPLLLAFIQFHVLATFSVEHSSHYLNCHGNDFTDDTPEINERLMLNAKSLFIQCMSSMEYCAKTLMVELPEVIKISKNGYITFYDILEASKNYSLINDTDSGLWRGARLVRNIHVHNGGYGNRTESWTYSKVLKINMVNGEMQYSSIMQFLHLTEWIFHAFADWTDKFIKLAND